MNRNNIYKHIGATVRERRKRMEKTQDTLAREVGMSRAALANIETGRQNVLVHQLYELAKVLDLMPADFLPLPSTIRADDGALPIPSHLNSNQAAQVNQFYSDSTSKPMTKGQPRDKKASR